MLGQSSTAITKHYLDSFDQEQIHEINNFLPDSTSNFLVLVYFLLLNQKTGIPISSAITPRITASIPAPKKIQTENPKPKKV